MQEEIDHPAPPLHPPTGGDVPTWTLATGPTANQPVREAVGFVDSTGHTIVETFENGLATHSAEEVVRNNFVRLRKAKGWSQKGAAHRLTDVSHGKTPWSEERVKRLERGRYKTFKTTDLFTFCHAFEAPLWELLLPASGELVSYTNNIVDRETASTLLFHVDSGVLDQDELGTEIAQILKQTKDAKWRKRWAVVEKHWETVEEDIRLQLDRLRNLEFEKFLDEIARLEEEKGEDDGTHS